VTDSSLPHQLDDQGRTRLLDETWREVASQHEGKVGFVRVGGQEAELLWSAAVDAFVAANWVATILCAQALCERTVAGLVSLNELPGAGYAAPKNWERMGLGELLKHTGAWLPPELLEDVQALCELRKPYGHWRRPLDPGTIQHSVVSELEARGWEADPEDLREELLSNQALLAARTATRLYWGGFQGPAGLLWTPQ